MFEATLRETSSFKKVFEVINGIANNVNILFEEDGLRMQAMDNTNGALAILYLKNKGFVRYRCDRPGTIGMNVGSFCKLLKIGKDDDKLTLRLREDGDSDVLQVEYESDKTRRFSSYSLNLLAIEVDDLDIPEVDYDARVTIPSTELANIIKDLNAIGENAEISVRQDSIKFSAQGNDATGQVWLKPDSQVIPAGQDPDTTMVGGDTDGGKPEGTALAKKRQFHDRTNTSSNSHSPTNKKHKQDLDTSRTVSIQLSSPVSLGFKLKYLTYVSRCAFLVDVVELSFGEDIPLMVRYDFSSRIGHILFYIAPLIGD
ncbi:proliferating cell nuclear antigen [Paramarasmius palmivorus]|uniref:DNA sliding clamp PCNA n=1 Tax=Paramarasmius palmivorus TaxID=297713 RepID=A0AAW0BJG2_9AGAR